MRSRALLRWGLVYRMKKNLKLIYDIIGLTIICTAFAGMLTIMWNLIFYGEIRIYELNIFISIFEFFIFILGLFYLFIKTINGIREYLRDD